MVRRRRDKMVRTYINARALSFFMSSPPLLDKQKVLFDITAGEHKDIMIHEMKKHERERVMQIKNVIAMT